MKSSYANYILSKVQKDYNDIADEFSRTRSSVWPETKFLTHYVKSGEKILDAGCGSGRLYELFCDCKIEYFGIDFAKVQIDYATCTIEELKFYSLDQVLKLEYWYRFHHGYKIPSVKDFLASLPKMKEEKKVDLPEISGRELPD